MKELIYRLVNDFVVYLRYEIDSKTKKRDEIIKAQALRIQELEASIENAPALNDVIRNLEETLRQNNIMLDSTLRKEYDKYDIELKKQQAKFSQLMGDNHE